MKVKFDEHDQLWCAEDESLPGVKVFAPTEAEARENMEIIKHARRASASLSNTK